MTEWGLFWGKVWGSSPRQWAKIKQPSDKTWHICVSLPLRVSRHLPCLQAHFFVSRALLQPIFHRGRFLRTGARELGICLAWPWRASAPKCWAKFNCAVHPEGIPIPILLLQGQDPSIKLDLVITPVAKEDVQCHVTIPGVMTYRWTMLLPGAGGRQRAEFLEKPRGHICGTANGD